MAGSDHRTFDDMGNGEAGCQAGPLKDALDQLAARIADADNRHAATLRELQERVIALGDRAMATRAALPPRYAAAFERVEEAMSALADRLSDGDGDRTTAPHAEQGNVVPSARTLPTDPDHADAFADEAARDVRRAMGRFEPQPQSAPPALRSAMATSGDWVRVEPPVAADSDGAQQDPVRNSELDAMWEPQAADALARHFHQDAHDGPATATDWPDIDEPAAAASAQFGIKAPVMRSTAAPAIEQIWLEDKLAEVASRVEQSLAEINPQNSFLALGERFDQFEQRFGSALDDVATRQDLEGLRLVEGQIGELFSHLDRTQAQLGRLDVIEEQLEDLRVRLSDENLAHFVGGGGAAPDDHHLMAIADAAAERVAMQMGEQMQAAAAASQTQADGGATEHAVAELAGLLQDYMSERRNGDANAAEALDTLQQAMQQLLDRLEALEAQQAQTADMHSAQMADATAARAVPAANRYDDAVRNASPSGPRSVVEEARAAARAASAGRPSLRVSDDDAPDQFAEAPRDDFARRGAEVAAQGARNETPTWTQSNSDADRKAFIAMARRAAERASNGGAAPAAEPTLETARTSATSGLRQRLSGGDAVVPAGTSRGIRPGVFMVASLAAFLLAGYWLISATKFRSLMPGASVERRIPTAAPSRANAPAGLSQQPPGLPAPAKAPAQPIPRKGASDATEEHGSAPESATPQRSSGLDSGTVGRIYERGIAIDGGSSQIDPHALERARRQVELASQSTRLGMQAARDTPSLHTAAARELREAVGSDAPTGSSAPATGSRVIEMPPAMIAPLSVRMAASKGDANAQLEIATRFAEGKGVPQDFAQAAVWYQRAATSGLPAAQYRLAALYERGLGVTADGARARVWYKRAAEQGNVRAMHNLAVLSASRAGGSPDYPAAVQWFTEAAKRGLADSQYNLGILSESGLGVPANAIDAYKWYSLAARSGDKEAMRRRDKIKSKLKPAELRAADSLVITWRALPIEGRANDPQAANLAWRGSAASKR